MIGGVDTINHPKMHLCDLPVASVLLFAGSHNLSWAPVSYMVVSKAAASRSNLDAVKHVSLRKYQPRLINLT
jgi:hypothetical protein